MTAFQLRIILCIGVLLIVLDCREATAQIRILSPLPGGVLQVRGNHADLWLRADLPVTTQKLEYRISSDTDTTPISQGWHTLDPARETIDTVFIIPRSLRNYTLYWRATIAGRDTGGSIANLTPGHIIGIAGQSNAQGYCWEMVDAAWGDIRMLRNNRAWEPASEPTGSIAGGPWIVMANTLYASLADSLPVGIVNVAVGGTGITYVGPGGQWKRNNSNPTDSSIYGIALSRFLCAGELECLCWIQGEADAAVLWTPETYRTVFRTLLGQMQADLRDSFPIYHLQVGGWSHTQTPFFPQVHEAQRFLPLSTLVGTGLGRSVQGDGVHFDVPSLEAIGRMFAGAILREGYGIRGRMYPPLIPDTVAHLDSILDGSIPGRYCFSIAWSRDSKPSPLSSIGSAQYFAIIRDGVPIDTSNVWFRLSPRDSSRVLVGLKNSPVTLDHDWRLTYDATSEADRAPLATIDRASGDTIFATAFYVLPVRLERGPALSVASFHVQSIAPSPGFGEVHAQILSYKHQRVDLEITNAGGMSLLRESRMVDEGLQDIAIHCGAIASGALWIRISNESGFEARKAIMIR